MDFKPLVINQPKVAGAFQIGSRKVSVQRKQYSKHVCHSAATKEAPGSVKDALANKCINAIRFLAIDGVNKANSGHPGAPMGLAPLAYLLYTEVLQFNPKNPKWINRDRFVLSAGHASMLLYSMLYLSGYESVQLEDLKLFRQVGSATPGHPENFETAGVEVTTGPLGQGIANAVGLAAAEAHLAARFNKPDAKPIIDHYTYAILGDGCMMEGVSNEACSLAGHLGLGNLIAFYDSNDISIDGHTDISFTEDVPKRYEALGWHVQIVQDGNTDIEGMRQAIKKAKEVTDKPSLIVIRTLIGYGSPNKANTHGVHGAPLGADETSLTRKALGWEYGEFEVPDDALKEFRKSVEAGKKAEQEWQAAFDDYSSKYADEAKEFKQIMSGELPSGWEKALPKFSPEDKGLATRQHSNTMLNALATVIPGFLGGSADLAPSNLTLMKAFGDFQKNQYAERNLRFGVREHGMGAIGNGLAAYSPGLIPYTATFFIFTDYMRAAIRVAALSQLGVIYVMTHDSIGLGEDGPTHQPIEHLASFRAMPNILTIRPCGGSETAGAYQVAIKNRTRPSILALSRQAMPNLKGCTQEDVEKGAYVVQDSDGTPEIIIIGTGSELPMAVEAADKLKEGGKKVRVVSMPCAELFDEQSKEYQDKVLPPSVTKRVSIEAGSTYGWLKYVGCSGKSIGVDSFGASGPATKLYEHFGITTQAVIDAANSL